MVQSGLQVRRQVTIHWNTKNQSFLDMHAYLKATGRKNNAFFLMIYDTDLMNVDPRDPNINAITKGKILRECMANFWYFIREVVRIPTQGGEVGGGVRYELNRGNLAFHFLFLNNYNIFLEMPRQVGKTTAALVQYLWVFNYRTSNSEIIFIHQKHQRAKDNLNDLKDLRAVLPSYLRMDSLIMPDGTKAKAKNTVETLEHPSNFNKIRTMAGSRSATQARNSARGMTVPLQYWDEFGFILYNREMYLAAVPAFSRAKSNAMMNGAPYSIVLTTTPGVLTTDEGVFAKSVRDNATQWTEAYYDYTRAQLEELRKANEKSSFFHIRYTYQQLGKSAEWFKQQCIDMEHDYVAIRREIMLEWSKASDSCPFKPEDLETIETLCAKEPISQLLFGSVGQYHMDIWRPLDNMQYPPIVGVDVAGGYQADSTAITVIDSKTTKVSATFNCNYISMPDTAGLIEQLVSRYLPNAIVNIERDGGWGGSVLQMLCKSKIKKNLYYEIKDIVTQERVQLSGKINRTHTKTMVFGTSTAIHRDRLIEILFQRVQYHKDKFIAPILLDELRTLEYKKNGRVEHASDAHDDQLFSYMMALYVWYDGVDINKWGVYKTAIQTDQEMDEASIVLDRDYGVTIDLDQNEKTNELIEEQFKQLGNTKYMDQNTFRKQEYEKDQEILKNLLENDENAKKAYILKYHLDPADLGPLSTRSVRDIPDSTFIDDPWEEKEYSPYQGNLGESYNNIGSWR